MPIIGLLRTNSDCNYSLLATGTLKSPGYATIYAFGRRDIGFLPPVKKSFTDVKIKRDNKTLFTLEEIIFKGVDKIHLFNISEEEYNFITDENRNNSIAYIKKVILPWYDKIRHTPREEIRTKLHDDLRAYENQIPTNLLHIPREQDAITRIAYLKEPKLYGKGINSLGAHEVPKKWQAEFYPKGYKKK